MQTRAKERLTGAVILVAAVVLLVPELLSGPSDHGTPTPPPRAATAGGPQVRTLTIPLSGGATGTAPATSAAAMAPSATATPRTAASAAAGATAETAASPGIAVRRGTAEARGAAARPEPQRPPAQSQLQRPARPPQAQQAAVSERPARLPAARRSAGRATVAAAERAKAVGHRAPHEETAGWTVQVASFTTRDHAERLVRALERKGFAAFVTRGASRGRTWYRVRVGPERDRAAAASVARRLHSQGHTGALLERPR